MRFEIVDWKFRKHPDKEIILPTKATRHSAGYDFYSNETFSIKPGETKILWTDVKVKLTPEEFLMIVPRSSIGLKKNLMLSNTVGIIDSDYYGNLENDGNIGIAIYNYGNKTREIREGERIAQGIVLKFEDNTLQAYGKRKGGFGSTGI